jgi:energy-coupling factor transporter ATP-binding protein EcfA2
MRVEWSPGEHITLIGPSGSGKTHAALHLASLRDHSLVIATKRRDPLMEQLGGTHLVTQDLEADVLWTPDDKPLDPRLLYWPRFPEKMGTAERQAKQAAMIRKALDWADRTGGWAIVLDELIWLTMTLRLEREISSAYFQGRTQGVSMIACAQRPSHVPLLAFSQASYLFLWQSSDKRDVERLREISAGIPKELIEDGVRQLDWDSHECLFVDTKRRELTRVVFPATIGR